MISVDDIKRFGLTRQETRVCAMVADGLPQTKIAEALVVEMKAVYAYERRIRAKLDVATRPDAILRLREIGFGETQKLVD